MQLLRQSRLLPTTRGIFGVQLRGFSAFSSDEEFANADRRQLSRSQIDSFAQKTSREGAKTNQARLVTKHKLQKKQQEYLSRVEK